MLSETILRAVFGNPPMMGVPRTLHAQVIWLTLLGFTAVAAWFDARERRIPNVWNLSGLVVLLGLQVWSGASISAFIAVFLTGLVMLLPTIYKVWGQGDWKMAMVYGAALGVLPTLVIWWLAMLMAKVYSTALKKDRVRQTRHVSKPGLPVAVFVLTASTFIFATLSFM
ncbi:prepilin peptidase [Alicyclobacillus sp. ALC3]|uniref:prepilin peptidase n=1 Tax=Alicyclobacillus sp. ALC3 TaxID=2796143 RepID=UPI00237912B8|nr:A24 family peptidase [Alicyclobacillus sp. ALC3]WDL96758.1 prepilin peptidase [Alicyclobacillus sp. ALC3]